MVDDPRDRNRQMSTSQTRVLSHTDIAPEAWDDVAPSHARRPKLLHDWARLHGAGLQPERRAQGDRRGPGSQPDALLPLSVDPGLLRWHRFIANDDGGLSIPAPRRRRPCPISPRR